jgi:hypothetical protein
MRGGIEPERIVAGVALLLLAAFAAAGGGLGLLVAPILGFAPPDALREAERSLLLTVAALWGFAVILAALAAFVMTGRHSQVALALATVLVASAIAALGVEREPLVLILLGIVLTTASALVIGALRRLRQ